MVLRNRLELWTSEAFEYRAGLKCAILIGVWKTRKKAERSVDSEGLSYEGSKGSKDSIGSSARGHSDYVMEKNRVALYP